MGGLVYEFLSLVFIEGAKELSHKLLKAMLCSGS